MNMKKIYCISFSILVLGAWMGLGQAQAAEITYTPLNPNFGGNPFNAAPLMNSAAAQNKFTAPRAQRATPPTAAQRFAQRLDSAILSRLTRQVLGAVFDPITGELVNGTINTGVNTIDVFTSPNGGTIIQITNTETGEVTVIEAPNIVP
jgi:curli production assembly/transport component CsgF